LKFQGNISIFIGRRIGVDFDKGRTIIKFRPRKFGGQLGNVRPTKE